MKERLKRLINNDYALHGLIGSLIVLVCFWLDVVFEASIIARSAALILALIFAHRYSKRPWRSTREGRHLMSFTLIVAAFLTYATVNNVVSYLDAVPGVEDGYYPGRKVVGLILYMLVAWELHQRNRLLSLARHAKSSASRLDGLHR